MPLPRPRLLPTLFLLTLTPPATFALYTRNSPVYPLPTTDPLFRSAAYERNNPDRNPATQDVCVKRVPVGRVRGELLGGKGEGEGRLVEEFCRGVWGGWGYAFQRAYLARKYKSPSTSHQLWSPTSLLTSTYPAGTQITDHFEVVSHTRDAIVVRCGDSPRNAGRRPSDGLFEMSAAVVEGEGVVEFKLKSVFFSGVGRTVAGPMPWHVEVLHRWYTKLWMETAVGRCVK